MLERQLFIKRSGIPSAGLGLFTKAHIKKNVRIIEYKGKITTWKKILEREERTGNFNGYVYYINRDHVIDAEKRKSALARYANDAKGFNRVKGINNNCKFEKDKGKVFIKAVKDIAPGEEIFVRYGSDYWKPLKFNKKLSVLQKKA